MYLQKLMVRFGFCRSFSENLTDKLEDISSDDDRMTMYDTESEDESDNYYWQPAPEPHHHRVQRLYKVCNIHREVTAYIYMLLVGLQFELPASRTA